MPESATPARAALSREPQSMAALETRVQKYLNGRPAKARTKHERELLDIAQNLYRLAVAERPEGFQASGQPGTFRAWDAAKERRDAGLDRALAVEHQRGYELGVKHARATIKAGIASLVDGLAAITKSDAQTKRASAELLAGELMAPGQLAEAVRALNLDGDCYAGGDYHDTTLGRFMAADCKVCRVRVALDGNAKVSS